MTKKLKYITSLALFLCLIYLAFWRDVVGAERLISFWLWSTAVFLLIAAPVKKCRDELRKSGRPFPNFVDQYISLLMIIFFVWKGCWWNVIPCVIILFTRIAIYYPRKKKTELRNKK